MRPAHFDEFIRRYRLELRVPMRVTALSSLRELARHRTVTLLTAIRHIEVSQSTVLADLITARTGG